MSEVETKILTNYDMPRLLSRIRKEYGEVVRGREEEYNPQLDYIEHEIYNVYKKIPISDYELQDAILMAIYDLKGYVDNKFYDYTNIRDKKVMKYTKNLEMLFDPFLNKEIKITDEAKKDLKGLFTLPIICLARIYDSVGFWRIKYGKDGYFRMLEEYVLPLNFIGLYPYALEECYLRSDNKKNKLFKKFQKNFEKEGVENE